MGVNVFNNTFKFLPFSRRFPTTSYLLEVYHPRGQLCDFLSKTPACELRLREGKRPTEEAVLQ